MAAKAWERDGKLSGIATGLSDLDRIMGGLQASDLVIVAGPPRHGKDGARDQHGLQHRQGLRGPRPPGRRHGDRERRHRRLLLARDVVRAARDAHHRRAGGGRVYKIRRGDITEPEFHRIAEAARDMQSIPFYIDQTGGLSIAQLIARARRLKRQRGLDVLVVDYLQLLSGSKSKGDNRVQELTEITTGLKALAKELAVR